MNRVLSLLFLVVICSSCVQKYKIKGVSSISSLDGRMLFIKTLQNGTWVNVDSAEVIHGLFSMKGLVDSIMMVTLYMDNEPLMPFVLEKGDVEIKLTNTLVEAKGTPLNDDLYGFIAKKSELDEQLNELEHKEAQMVMEGVDLDEIHVQLAQEGEALTEEMSVCIKNFISDNYETVLGPSVFMMLCSSLPYPIITPQIEDIMKDAPHSFKTNKIIKEFISKAKENKMLIQEHERMQQNVPVGH